MFTPSPHYATVVLFLAVLTLSSLSIADFDVKLKLSVSGQTLTGAMVSILEDGLLS